MRKGWKKRQRWGSQQLIRNLICQASYKAICFIRSDNTFRSQGWCVQKIAAKLLCIERYSKLEEGDASPPVNVNFFGSNTYWFFLLNKSTIFLPVSCECRFKYTNKPLGNYGCEWWWQCSVCEELSICDSIWTTCTRCQGVSDIPLTVTFFDLLLKTTFREDEFLSARKRSTTSSIFERTFGIEFSNSMPKTIS